MNDGDKESDCNFHAPCGRLFWRVNGRDAIFVHRLWRWLRLFGRIQYQSCGTAVANVRVDDNSDIYINTHRYIYPQGDANFSSYVYADVYAEDNAITHADAQRQYRAQRHHHEPDIGRDLRDDEWHDKYRGCCER